MSKKIKIKSMKEVFWKITIIGSVLGILTLLATLKGADSAPQQAAGAAIAVAFTVIPYCLARAISEIKSSKADNQNPTHEKP